MQPAQVLASTTSDLPLRDGNRNQPLSAGDSHWLLSVKAKGPLVGTVATYAPWMTLAGGLLGSLLIATVIETAARRRDAALALYASEHQAAETLQRSLLPQLPTLPGLNLAARYLASGVGQQVGGDWFDVFPLSGGRVGLAVGDVIGHDLAAASAMAQIRSALRAYAIHGDSPASVIMNRPGLVEGLKPRESGLVPAPRKYPNELRERALRLVSEAMAEDPHLSLNGAVLRIGPRVGVVPDTLRGWAKRARVDAGLSAGTTTSDAARLKALEREVMTLDSILAASPPLAL